MSKRKQNDMRSWIPDRVLMQKIICLMQLKSTARPRLWLLNQRFHETAEWWNPINCVKIESSSTFISLLVCLSKMTCCSISNYIHLILMMLVQGEKNGICQLSTSKMIFIWLALICSKLLLKRKEEEQSKLEWTKRTSKSVPVILFIFFLNYSSLTQRQRTIEEHASCACRLFKWWSNSTANLFWSSKNRLYHGFHNWNGDWNCIRWFHCTKVELESVLTFNHFVSCLLLDMVYVAVNFLTRLARRWSLAVGASELLWLLAVQFVAKRKTKLNCLSLWAFFFRLH